MAPYLYLKVAHTNDDDWDLFSFTSIERARAYILMNKIEGWSLSDTLFDAFKHDDYTFVG